MLRKFEKLIECCNILGPGKSLVIDKFGKEKDRMLIFEKDERFMEGTEIYNNVNIDMFKVRKPTQSGIFRYQNENYLENIKIIDLVDILTDIWKKT